MKKQHIGHLQMSDRINIGNEIKSCLKRFLQIEITDINDPINFVMPRDSIALDFSDNIDNIKQNEIADLIKNIKKENEDLILSQIKEILEKYIIEIAHPIKIEVFEKCLRIEMVCQEVTTPSNKKIISGKNKSSENWKNEPPSKRRPSSPQKRR